MDPMRPQLREFLLSFPVIARLILITVAASDNFSPGYEQAPITILVQLVDTRMSSTTFSLKRFDCTASHSTVGLSQPKCSTSCILARKVTEMTPCSRKALTYGDTDSLRRASPLRC